MADLLSGGRLMQTIFFYDLRLIGQWEGVYIDEEMEKKSWHQLLSASDFSEFKIILPKKF